MIVIILLLAVSLLISVGFLIAFFWSVDDGQMDDMTTPGNKILIEDKK